MTKANTISFIITEKMHMKSYLRRLNSRDCGVFRFTQLKITVIILIYL